MVRHLLKSDGFEGWFYNTENKSPVNILAVQR